MGTKHTMKLHSKVVLNAVEKKVMQGMNAATDEVMNKAKSTVPVDTGALRRSINRSVAKTSTGIRGRIAANTDYAKAVELGTYRMSPQPYLRPALFNNRQLILRRVAGK